MSLPKEVYVREELDHNNERYLIVGRDLNAEVVDPERTINTVGIYKLVRTARYRMVPRAVEEV